MTTVVMTFCEKFYKSTQRILPLAKYTARSLQFHKAKLTVLEMMLETRLKKEETRKT